MALGFCFIAIYVVPVLVCNTCHIVGTQLITEFTLKPYLVKYFAEMLKLIGVYIDFYPRRIPFLHWGVWNKRVEAIHSRKINFLDHLSNDYFSTPYITYLVLYKSAIKAKDIEFA